MIDLLLMITGPILIVAAAIVGVVLFLASVFDVLAVHRRTKLQKVPLKENEPSLQRATVIVYMESLQSNLQNCLRSVDDVSRNNVDVVIINNMKKRNARKFVQNACVNSNVTAKVYTPRKTVPMDTLLRNAYSRSKRGNTVIVITPDVQFPHKFIQLVIQSTTYGPPGYALKIASYTNQQLNFSTLLPIFISASGRIIEKAWQLVPRSTMRKPGYFYSRRTFASKKVRIPVRHDPAIYLVGFSKDGSTGRQPRLIRAVQLVFISLFVAFSTFVIIMAATLKTSTPLLLTWLIVSLWLAGVIWLDTNGSTRQKLALSVSIVPGYFLLLAAIAVHIAVYPFRYTRFSSLLST